MADVNDNATNNPVDAGQSEVVGTQQPKETDFSFLDSYADSSNSNDLNDDVQNNDSSDEKSEKNSDVADQKQEQTHDDNSKFAAARRKAEEEFNKKLAEKEQYLQQYANSVSEIEKYTGMKIDDVVNYVKNSYSQQQVQDVAEKTGVSEEVAKIILEQNTKLSSIEAREKEREFKEIQIQRNYHNELQKKELQKAKFWDVLEQDVYAIVESNPGVDVKTAFNFLRGQKMDELLEQEKSKTVKRTVADIADRQKRGEISDDGTPDITYTLSTFGQELAQGMGINKSNLAKRLSKLKKRS
jgi:hypothetical protein